MQLTGLMIMGKGLSTEKGEIMSYLKLWEKYWVTDYWSKGTMLGAIDVDPDKCIGCGVCVKICPGRTLKLDEKKYPVFIDPSQVGCFACGACAAICSEQAVELVQKMELTGIFKNLRRGPLSMPRLFEDLA